MRYLLDTDICIHLIRRRSDALLVRLRSFETGELALSTITVAELHYGVAKSRDPEQNSVALAAFLSPFDVQPFTDAAASVYGHIRSDLESRGKPLGSLDMLLAAHAMALQVPIVTHNTREFRRVSGLDAEDWLEA
jgi:tRNA(fMet)-specific endonuclease VapC